MKWAGTEEKNDFTNLKAFPSETMSKALQIFETDQLSPKLMTTTRINALRQSMVDECFVSCQQQFNFRKNMIKTDPTSSKFAK